MKLRTFLLSLAVVACFSLSCGDDDTPDNTIQVNFDFFWNTVNREYSYFEHKGIDWDAIRNEFESQINEDLTPTEFFDLLSEMVLRLRDNHSGITSNFRRSFFQGYRGEVDNSAVNLNLYLDNVVVSNNRITIANTRSKNLKYIGVHSLSGNTDDALFEPLYQSVADFSNYDGVIIDIRNNGGGNDAIARRFVQGFIDQTRDFRRYRFREPATRNSFTNWQTDQLTPNNSVNFTKPIVVLTNRYSVSSAEGFTLMLKALPNVSIVGDTTAGSTGNPGVFEMPNGWQVYASRWQVTDPDGNYVEDNGIAPDQVIWISETDRNNGRDSILEAAMARFD